MGEYFAFPTPIELSKATKEELLQLGCGYRADYIEHTAKAISELSSFEKFATFSDQELKKSLISLKGIGPKVADCIMLFGYGRTTSFPVDTWIVKSFGREKSEAVKLSKELTQKFGVLSGFAQQYIFYYKNHKLKWDTWKYIQLSNDLFRGKYRTEVNGKSYKINYDKIHHNKIDKFYKEK